MRLAILVLIIGLLSLTGCAIDHSEKGHGDYEVWGIDISRYQKRVEWDRVLEGDGPHFVFLKATEGTLIKDPSYEQHARELTDRGVLWGAYHFFGHKTSGREQARNFIKTANLRKGNLIPVLDIEHHRFFNDPKHMVREAKAFCKEIERYYGVEPIIYTPTLFYERYLKEHFHHDDYTLWIADYRGNPDHLGWHFWQHTDGHKMKGVGGGVDRNTFFGTKRQLEFFILK